MEPHLLSMRASCRPYGADEVLCYREPTADAVGYMMSPLRGFGGYEITVHNSEFIVQSS